MPSELPEGTEPPASHDRRQPTRDGPESSRRRLLRALGAGSGMATAVGTAGRIVGRSAASTEERVPLVWTRLPDGSPERGRRVPAERHRRLRAYCDLDVPALVGEHDALLGVSITHRRDGDGVGNEDGGLALALLVERATRRVRRALPDRMAGVPTALVEWRYRPTPSRVCRERALTFFEPVVGGIETYGKLDGERLFDGTIGPVCWDADGSICLLTAAHVASEDGEFADALYQDGRDDDGEYREERIATHAAHSTPRDGGVDVAKYRVVDDVPAVPLASAGHDQPDVTGSWDFAGLADATADGTVPVSFAGRSTCFGEGACVATFRSDLVDYGARIEPQVATAGDSGGAFLDDRGRLVALFTHRMPGRNSGPVGEVALERVEARLSPPD